MGTISEVVGGLLKPISEWAGKREERKALESQMKSQEVMKEHELKMAQYDRQIELKKQGLEADATWEMEFARQAASSWKDEYTLIVVSIPMVMAFVPGLAIYVQAGFEAFAKTPLWYQVMVQTLFYATVGIRLWRKTQYDTE
jgi:hypothetical protein